MKLTDLTRATEAHGRLNRAIQNLNAFKDLEVRGITVCRKDSVLASSDIQLSKNTHGTGRISSFGFPDEFRDYMTGSMRKYLEEDVALAREQLQKLGVDLG